MTKSPSLSQRVGGITELRMSANGVCMSVSSGLWAKSWGVEVAEEIQKRSGRTRTVSFLGCKTSKVWALESEIQMLDL